MTGREEIEQSIRLAGPIYDDAAAIDAIERIIRKRAAAELRAAADDRTTVSKLTPVESLTCFIVKLEDLFHRADALDPS